MDFSPIDFITVGCFNSFYIFTQIILRLVQICPAVVVGRLTATVTGTIIGLTPKVRPDPIPDSLMRVSTLQFNFSTGFGGIVLLLIVKVREREMPLLNERRASDSKKQWFIETACGREIPITALDLSFKNGSTARKVLWRRHLFMFTLWHCSRSLNSRTRYLFLVSFFANQMLVQLLLKSMPCFDLHCFSRCLILSTHCVAIYASDEKIACTEAACD